MQLIKRVQEPINWDDVSQLFQMEVGPRRLFGHFDQNGSILVEVKDEEGHKLLKVNPNITLRYLMCELWGPSDYQVVDHWTSQGEIGDGSLILTMLIGEVKQLDLINLIVNP